MSGIEIHRYQTAAARIPFDEWIKGLNDERAQARIQSRIDRLALGLWGDSKAVGNGVLELRIDYGPGYRVYLARYGTQVVILLAGGDKRTQAADIEIAKEYWIDYKKRSTRQAP